MVEKRRLYQKASLTYVLNQDLSSLTLPAINFGQSFGWVPVSKQEHIQTLQERVTHFQISFCRKVLALSVAQVGILSLSKTNKLCLIPITLALQFKTLSVACLFVYCSSFKITCHQHCSYLGSCLQVSFTHYQTSFPQYHLSFKSS